MLFVYLGGDIFLFQGLLPSLVQERSLCLFIIFPNLIVLVFEVFLLITEILDKKKKKIRTVLPLEKCNEIFELDYDYIF